MVSASVDCAEPPPLPSVLRVLLAWRNQAPRPRLGNWVRIAVPATLFAVGGRGDPNKRATRDQVAVANCGQSAYQKPPASVPWPPSPSGNGEGIRVSEALGVSKVGGSAEGQRIVD